MSKKKIAKRKKEPCIKVTHVTGVIVTPIAQPFVAKVQQERKRQDEKWGIQKHTLDAWCGILAEEFGSFAKAVNELRMSLERTQGIDLPLDSRFERVIEELVHTSAVAQVIYEQWILPTLKKEQRKWATCPNCKGVGYISGDHGMGGFGCGMCSGGSGKVLRSRLKKAEDQDDLREARKALKEGNFVPLEDVKKELGL